MTATGWTLDELTGRVAAALYGASYTGAPNGRVRDVPDARAIRWYATIGLVDRPAMQGRTALYGPRHLIQLVAIKRLQAQGKRIADIQAELAEAPDDVLAGIAALPSGEVLATADATDEAARPRRRFWTDPPSAHDSPDTRVEPDMHDPPAAGGAALDTPHEAEAVLLSGLPLDGGAVLLLPGAPTTDDIEAIRSAARPLLDLLAARGLLRQGPTKQRQPKRSPLKSQPTIKTGSAE